MINYWTDAEIAMLRNNILPPGRKLKSAYTKAFRLGICFCPVTKKSYKAQRDRTKYVTGSVIRELEKTGKVRATARKYGISYTTVMEIARKAGIKVNPDSLQKRAETIVFEGRNYAWHDSGYYWRCTTGKRESLARVLYERAHGPIKGRKVVVFKDGNRYNLDVSNLVCMTPSRQTKERYEKDPLYRASCIAGLALGRLRTQINETVDPELKRKRTMKENENKVNKYAVCLRCVNNGCRFCKKCDGVFYFKVSLAQDPILCKAEPEEKKKKAREYQQEYYRKHKAELLEKRRSYFRKYYHEKIKNNLDQVERRRLRGLKYYYDHHDEIRSKRNAKKRADWKDPSKVETLRKEHKEYMREYRKKKNAAKIKKVEK